MGTTKIMQCKCRHEYQDQKYGNGMRVYNVGASTRGVSKARCTVCGTEVTMGDTKPAKETKEGKEGK